MASGRSFFLWFNRLLHVSAELIYITPRSRTWSLESDIVSKYFFGLHLNKCQFSDPLKFDFVIPPPPIMVIWNLVTPPPIKGYWNLMTPHGFVSPPNFRCQTEMYWIYLGCFCNYIQDVGNLHGMVTHRSNIGNFTVGYHLHENESSSIYGYGPTARGWVNFPLHALTIFQV